MSDFMKEIKVETNEFIKGISKNLAFDHLILNPSPKGEGQKEFLEMPLTIKNG